jgi:hypothetical protein
MRCSLQANGFILWSYNNIMEKKISVAAEKSSAHFRHSKDTVYNWLNAQVWKSERMASMGNQ